MSSALAKRYAALPARKYRVFQPKKLAGDMPEGWLAAKPQVNIDSNMFAEVNANSDDLLLLMRQSSLFHVREGAHAEAREAQLSLLDELEKKKEIVAVPEKWASVIATLKRGSKQKAETEYTQLSKWKVRTEERKPDADVFAHDYLWVMHALKAKTLLPEAYTQHYFPLPFVVSGIKKLAQKLLHITPPEEQEWYRNLCPWIFVGESIPGYPPCLTAAQTFQLFRHAGTQLAAGVFKDNPDLLLSGPQLCGFVFEKFAASPQFMSQYANHWSRVELSPSAPREFLTPKQSELLAQSYRAFPAFRLQQAWWYSQPHRLREETLEEGIYFYPVPSARHTLQAGLPALRGAASELAAQLLWGHLADPEEFDLTTDDVYDEFRGAIEEVQDEASNAEAWERCTEELFGSDSPLMKTKDLTRQAPTFPNEFYDETYRPILRYEIDHAASKAIEMPEWYLRRRRELATGPFSHLVPDLSETVRGETLDFTADFDDEEEPIPEEAQETKKPQNEDDDDESLEGVENVKDAAEDTSLPLVERMRLQRLQTAIASKQDHMIKDVLQARDYATHHENLDHQYEKTRKVQELREEKRQTEASEVHPADARRNKKY